MHHDTRESFVIIIESKIELEKKSSSENLLRILTLSSFSPLLSGYPRIYGRWSPERAPLTPLFGCSLSQARVSWAKTNLRKKKKKVFEDQKDSHEGIRLFPGFIWTMQTKSFYQRSRVHHISKCWQNAVSNRFWMVLKRKYQQRKNWTLTFGFSQSVYSFVTAARSSVLW